MEDHIEEDLRIGGDDEWHQAQVDNDLDALNRGD